MSGRKGSDTSMGVRERTVRWRWTITPWRGARSRWAIEVKRRNRLRHSQVRVYLGRRRFTLHAVSQIVRPTDV